MSDRSGMAQAYGGIFLLAFALSALMLATDQNLRTGFGTVSSGYFSHWYVVLLSGIADLVGAAILLVYASRSAIKLGLVGAVLQVLMLLASITTYQSVGFATPDAFARYLFGIDYYGGYIRYLFDALLAVYLLAVVLGVALLRRRGAPVPGEPRPPVPGPSP